MFINIFKALKNFHKRHILYWQIYIFYIYFSANISFLSYFGSSPNCGKSEFLYRQIFHYYNLYFRVGIYNKGYCEQRVQEKLVNRKKCTRELML